MKYSAVYIKPFGNSWSVQFDNIGERKKGDYQPLPNGTYYYPTNTSKVKAFNKLKIYLLHRHIYEFNKIVGLQLLEIPEEVKCSQKKK
jgi:hypothetical protein